MREYLVTEVNFNNEKCFFTSLYKSPSQNDEEIEYFCSSLDLLLSNINDRHPACSIGIGHFNAKSRNVALLTKITLQALQHY